ncbi:MAG: formate/nitrite transporter family protein [Chloroflexi bacterium]|nr:formate/nitrite transporter family protein [Chloroflexota bacterium]
MAEKLYSLGSLTETIADASEAAEKKCMLKFGQVLVLGVIASAYLAMATTLSIAVAAGIEPTSLQKLVMGAVFPVGLIAVIIAVSELSTGNYLTTALGALSLRVSWKQTLYNWAGSYAGNFLGAFLLAVVIIFGARVLVGPMWGEQWIALLQKTVAAKASLSPVEAFFRGILCIWLVDLAVWQAYRVKDTTSKFLLIWFPTFAFFALGLEHSVVNMFLFPTAIFTGADVTWSQFLVNNLTPVVMGNVVGGVFIVGVLYWYSAGLPIVRRLGNGSAEVLVEQGSSRVLEANLAKGVATSAAFVVLFPGIAGGLSLLLPADLGLFIPITVTAYLAAAALVLPKVLGRMPDDAATETWHGTKTQSQGIRKNGSHARQARAQVNLKTLVQNVEDS